MLEWTKERRIALILDESFLDFAEDKEASLLTDEMLNRYPGLYIVKKHFKVLWGAGTAPRDSGVAGQGAARPDKEGGVHLEYQFHGRIFLCRFLISIRKIMKRHLWNCGKRENGFTGSCARSRD